MITFTDPESPAWPLAFLLYVMAGFAETPLIAITCIFVAGFIRLIQQERDSTTSETNS